GIVEVARGRGEWERHDTSGAVFGKPNNPPDNPANANYRVLGIAELAEAIRTRRASRLSGDVALHALEVMEGVLRSGARNRAITLPATRARPGVMTEEDAAALAAD
ncbi:MAG: gfo/Idh/MocA family oxidoreductase, partial [Hyphomicrobiales bacterium]|nr:gfo/Idh/MocA family oxidoreductase [Hyphomicrobiales bacterium]